MTLWDPPQVIEAAPAPAMPFVGAQAEHYFQAGRGHEDIRGLGLSVETFEAGDCAPVARVAPGCMLLPNRDVSPVTPIGGSMGGGGGGGGGLGGSMGFGGGLGGGLGGGSVNVAPQEMSPRPGSAGMSAGAAACIHPQRWTEEQVRAWWDRRTRRRRDIGTPSRGTDGRNIMRWPIARFEQLCNGNTGMAAALYQDLRNEMKRYEDWKRVCMGLAEDNVPLVQSPRTESRRTRATQPDNAQSRTKARSPGYHGDTPHEPGSSPAYTSFGSWRADGPLGNSSPSPGPARRSGGGGGSMSAPLGSAHEDKARRVSGGHSSASTAQPSPVSHTPFGQARGAGERDSAAPRSGHGAAQAKAGAFKFAPANRHAEVSPAVQRRSATAVDPVRVGTARPANSAVRPGVPLQAVPEPAGAGRKSRVKSAPRPSRKPAAGDGHRPQAAAAHAAPPPHRASGSAAAAHGGGDRSNAPAKTRQMHASASEKKKPRARVMEDLQDETLAGVGTPKHGREVLGASRERPQVVRSARDDSEITRRPRGNAGDNAQHEEEDDSTRRMFDKRHLRRRHRDVFDQQLALWRANNLQSERGSGMAEAAPSRVRVCVRKRPLFDRERMEDEFDVISVRDGSEIVVHNCLTKADLRTLFVSHMGFQFSHAFGASATDDEVYSNCAAPAVMHVLNEGVATIFMFGQTGSGKTHTMGGLIERAMAHLTAGGAWRRPAMVSANGTVQQPHCPSIVAFEIAGRTMRDLLDTPGAQKEIKVMEDKGHRTRVLGLCHWEAGSAEELLRFLYEAQRRRTTRATQVNDTSSRSHAVYRISLGAPDGAHSLLTLVDCAGSERREDSSHHDVQSRKDAAEINSTIFALKECFRVMRSSKSGQQPPYRESLLTRVLADSFSSDSALIVAIGTVSPSATDTEHSIGTLRALQQLQGTQMAFEEREDVAKPRVHDDIQHPRHWSEEEVRGWLEGALGGRARAHVSGLSKGTDGKNLLRWPVTRFTQLCAGDDDLGTRLYQDLRQKIRSAGA
mmetsp:Transcript_57273/g.107687  ORF Transcript_57273/g.107687 Transcript_57273/m.107687 type:complete len:1019 (-) Transcript_57273:39-3095(-)